MEDNVFLHVEIVLKQTVENGAPVTSDQRYENEGREVAPAPVDCITARFIGSGEAVNAPLREALLDIDGACWYYAEAAGFSVDGIVLEHLSDTTNRMTYYLGKEKSPRGKILFDLTGVPVVRDKSLPYPVQEISEVRINGAELPVAGGDWRALAEAHVAYGLQTRSSEAAL